MTASEKIVIMVVASRGDLCFSSLTRMLFDTGLSKTRFYKVRASLIKKGILNVQKGRVGEVNRSARMTLNLSVLETLSAECLAKRASSLEDVAGDLENDFVTLESETRSEFVEGPVIWERQSPYDEYEESKISDEYVDDKNFKTSNEHEEQKVQFSSARTVKIVSYDELTPKPAITDEDIKQYLQKLTVTSGATVTEAEKLKIVKMVQDESVPGRAWVGIQEWLNRRGKYDKFDVNYPKTTNLIPFLMKEDSFTQQGLPMTPRSGPTGWHINYGY
jgi:hypothetical protein